jgi:aryl-alcohol dehydrogenase-like predicted oxidoreductase
VKIAPVAAVQVDYSIASREIEGAEGTNILATCRELGVAVVAAMPLSRGLISSRFSEGQTFLEGDIRPLALPRFKGDNAELNRLFVKKLSAFAEEKGCTVAQLALAWLIKQGDDIIPIPGTKQIKYLEQNLGALDVTLTDADEAKIREFLKTDNVAGTAVPESYMSMLYQDTKEESK